VRRLLGLGLFDDWGRIAGHPHATANPLARPLATAIPHADRPRLARAAFPRLAEAWRDAKDGLPADPRGVVAAEIALEGGAEPAALEEAVLAGAAWLARAAGETRAALELVAAALDAVPAGYAAGPAFLRLGIETASTLGEAELLGRLLAMPVRPPPTDAPADRTAHAALDLRRAQRLVQTGEVALAERLVRGALETFAAADDARSSAIAAGQIADILQARGQLDEALKIRNEEQLPVYERLGDVRERAVTMGRIADILQARGQLDEALKIRQEDELPVYERLGDVRTRAVTMGKVADILQTRGQLDEALKIRNEELLPTFERLGDVRERTVTIGRIADILQDRGQLDEALRIRREEQLPVYERLGDVRERAVTMGRIADILQDRGQLDEALRIRREEQLPVYDRLGDVRSRAVTMGKIADILLAGGQLEEALRIWREEELPLYERLGDVRERATTLQRIALALLQADGIQKGRIQEIYDAFAEAYGIARQLGLLDGIACIGPMLAQILASGGHQEEASTVLEEAEVALEKLGNADGVSQVRSYEPQSSASSNNTREETHPMPETSFVETLVIADDERLRSLHPDRPVGVDAEERRRQGVDVVAQPEAIDDSLGAAVNAGSIVSFVAGIGADEETDVLFATQLAQRAASARHDRFAATADWYRAYVEVLEQLGWVGEGFAFEERLSRAHEFAIDKAALDAIMTIATGNQLAILVKTLDTLKNLGPADAPLRVFELQALAGLSGNFQIGAVQRAENGALSVALGAFYFHAKNVKTGAAISSISGRGRRR
jgi:tetratricopeptide (TPR) repeat protein